MLTLETRRLTKAMRKLVLVADSLDNETHQPNDEADNVTGT